MTETQRTWFHGEEQLTLITDAVPALVSYIDSQCRYQFCNATYREWFGVSENRLIGRHCREVLGEDAWRDIGPYVEAALAGQTQEIETQARYQHGGTRWIHAAYRPHRDESGNVLGIVVMVLDITERKQAELALRQQEEIAAKAFSIETVGVIFFDLRGHITNANSAFERMSGYKVAELRSMDWHVLTAAEFIKATHRAAENLMGKGVTPPYEKQMIRKNGSRWWGLFAPTRVNGAGQDSQCVEFIIDITEAKHYENQLRAQTRLLDLSSDAIISRDLDGKIVFWNVGSERIYGWGRQEALGQNIHELLKTRWPEPLQQITRKLTSVGNWTGELIHTTRSGELKTIFCRKILDRERNLVLETNTDLTELRNARTALAQREELLRSLAREAQVGLLMIDKDRRYLFANSRHAKILGVADDNLEGKRVEDVVGPLYEQMRPNLDRAFNGEHLTYELCIPHHPKTGEERFCEVVYEPRLDNPNNAYVVVVISDITEREMMQQYLERTVADRTTELRETNEHLEAFVYSIAHDLRAPLRAMQGYSHLLIENGESHFSEQEKMFVRKINQSAEFMDKLVLDLLAFGRTASTEIHFGPVDLKKVWDAAVEQCSSEIERTNAQLEVATPLCQVRAHEPTLTQVIVNLLSNAMKFVEAGVRPHVRFGCADSGNHVCIWIQDNGVGIEPKYHERIFRVFERLHGSEFAGTGIGLAIVRKGIDRMNGTIGLDSEPGKGTRFWIELPKA
ncbi:MAG: PAS domain-containing sensor histidine kinase [Limisphaerales bacterium]